MSQLNLLFVLFSVTILHSWPAPFLCSAQLEMMGHTHTHTLNLSLRQEASRPLTSSPVTSQTQTHSPFTRVNSGHVLPSARFLHTHNITCRLLFFLPLNRRILTGRRAISEDNKIPQNRYQLQLQTLEAEISHLFKKISSVDSFKSNSLC